MIQKALIAAVIGLAVWGGVQSWRLSSEKLAHIQTQKDYALRVASAEKDRADEESRRRKAEQELTDVQAQIDKQAAAFRAQLDAARTDARMAADKLRASTASAVAAARAKCANPATTGGSETASDPIGLLGRLFAESDEIAGILAESLDRSRAAGLACERAYNAARTAVQ